MKTLLAMVAAGLLTSAVVTYEPTAPPKSEPVKPKSIAAFPGGNSYLAKVYCPNCIHPVTGRPGAMQPGERTTSGVSRCAACNGLVQDNQWPRYGQPVVDYFP